MYFSQGCATRLYGSAILSLSYYILLVKVNGTKYSTSSVLAIAVEDELPVFGRVNRIFVTGKVVTFEVNCLYTKL